jgi:hypothetical protein
MHRKRPLQLAIVLAIALAGILLRAATWRGEQVPDLCGSDFPVFYAAGKLIGTPIFYSPQAVQEIQVREMGCTTQSAVPLRLPYFGLMMRPFSSLPFWPAFELWRVTTLICLAVFVILWPAPRQWSLLACAWSLPLAYCLLNGQDDGLLLMWIAIALFLLERDAPFTAGLMLSLCAAKLHLFLPLPLLLLRPEARKASYGLLLGGSTLLAISFLVQGRDWPEQLISNMQDFGSTGNPDPVNLHGLVRGNSLLEAIFFVLIIAAIIYICRKSDLRFSFAAIFVAGLLLGNHQTVSDAVLLIPSALLLAFHPSARSSKVVAIFVITPLAYALAVTPGLKDVPRVMLLALIGLLCQEARSIAVQPKSILDPITATA